MTFDALVLGGGAVGTSIALHLALRGRSVALVDRRAPGEETSHGNAGLIERSSLLPVAFPRDLAKLTRIALGRDPVANFHWTALPALIPWLVAYWRASDPAKLLATARIMQPFLATTVEAHRDLAHRAQAEHFFRDGGWIKIYRTEKGLAGERREFDLGRTYGLEVAEYSVAETLAREPHLTPNFLGAVHWRDPHSVSSPGGVVKAYAALLEKIGGKVLVGDASTLAAEPQGWTVSTTAGRLHARDAVVAMGPWSMDVLSPLGYRMPLAVKRGYHMHYRPKGNAGLTLPVLDEENGYVLAPMERGIRLTTGAEFARRDAPKTPVQLEATEKLARGLFPLDDRVDPEPWMGARPIFPDSLPVIGAAPRHKGLWMAFGHQHLGFTLGPATGRLLAEMMTGAAPHVDPAPFTPNRF